MELEAYKPYKIIMRSNGSRYRVRFNRDRYFYPHEWVKFFGFLKYKQRFTFDLLLATGARINEIRHVQVQDIDFERNSILLKVTKTKSAKKEKHPRPRTVSISSQMAKKIRRWIHENHLKTGDFLGILSTPGANKGMKVALRKAEIRDWKMFSVHNVRKTHGNWLKALGVEAQEICLRLGHDFNTFLRSYGSPDVFNMEDLQNIRFLLGDLYLNWRARQRM